ncbi:MAG: hypothetical protein QOD14_1560 [Solirubrobacterales bacterium]|jgi:diguanylate cyclase (GGDEF)-like protein|nr:hypothetical protein [Solirubrobacterales bacterium]
MDSTHDHHTEASPRGWDEERRELLSELARLTDQVDRALHDSLTGLPNRSLVIEQLVERLERGSEPALVLVDLDRFRAINDRVGHPAGDRMLVELAQRLHDAAGEDELVARIAGDAFVLLSSSGEAEASARRVLEAVALPFEIDGRELWARASVGVVNSGKDAEQMLRDADLAVHRAKSDGGSRIVTFQPGIRTEVVKQLELREELARALEKDEIVAYFQPKVDLRSARVIGVEALVRWAHPKRGLVSPDDFLPLAEAGGHMRALTERVIEFSARLAGDWWRSGLGLQLSVNLPAGSLCDRGWKLDDFVAATLMRTGLPGNVLQFEVTEDALMADPEVAAETLNRLSALGATISLDDFGTGHSSLGRMKSLPIDELKIDRSFIVGLADEESRAIVRSTIHLAHQMGLQVVAEGVETEATWRELRSMGCERAQGFFVAEPLPAREIPAWLASWNQRARELSRTRRSPRIGAKPAREGAASRPKTAA